MIFLKRVGRGFVQPKPHTTNLISWVTCDTIRSNPFNFNPTLSLSLSLRNPCLRCTCDSKTSRSIFDPWRGRFAMIREEMTMLLLSLFHENKTSLEISKFRETSCFRVSRSLPLSIWFLAEFIECFVEGRGWKFVGIYSFDQRITGWTEWCKYWVYWLAIWVGFWLDRNWCFPLWFESCV